MLLLEIGARAEPAKDGAESKPSSSLFDLARRVLRSRGLGSSTLTLLQLGLDRFQRVDFSRLLHCSDLAHHPVERRLVQLSFRVRLLGLRLRAIEVAHNFSDRIDVAGIYFGLVFLSPTRPHGALDARASG